LWFISFFEKTIRKRRGKRGGGRRRRSRGGGKTRRSKGPQEGEGAV
jgi:hypothetical protein